MADLRGDILKEIEHTLDFSYYRLGNHAIKALLPYLATEEFLSVKELDLSYNNLTDEGVDAVIQKLASLGSQIEVLNLSGNKISDSMIKKIADHIKHKIKKLGTIILDDCKGISSEAMNVLKIALMKVTKNAGNAKLNRMFKRAKEEDEEELSEGNKFD